MLLQLLTRTMNMDNIMTFIHNFSPIHLIAAVDEVEADNVPMSFLFGNVNCTDSSVDCVSSLIMPKLYDSFRIVCALVAVLITFVLLVDVYGSLVVYRKVNARVPRQIGREVLCQPRSV
jgi:hypothetical protein